MCIPAWRQGLVVPSLRPPFDRLLRFRAKPVSWSVESAPHWISARQERKCPSGFAMGRTGPWNCPGVWIFTGPPIRRRPIPADRGACGRRRRCWASRWSWHLRAADWLQNPAVGGRRRFLYSLADACGARGAVLRTIEQILEDTPDPAAAGTVGALKQTAPAIQGGTATAGGRLFEDACRLREALLLRRNRLRHAAVRQTQAVLLRAAVMDAPPSVQFGPAAASIRLSPVRPGRAGSRRCSTRWAKRLSRCRSALGRRPVVVRFRERLGQVGRRAELRLFESASTVPDCAA